MARAPRKNPLFNHASLMQSGFVQARLKPRTMRSFSSVIARSFDDGHTPGEPSSGREPIDLDASQYDVLASNPRLNTRLYEQVSAAASVQADKNEHECDVAAANPNFDARPYEATPNGHAIEAEPQTEPEMTAANPVAAPSMPSEYTRVAAKRVAPTPISAPALDASNSGSSNSTAQSVPAKRTSSFTTRELNKLVKDEDFRADLDAILNGDHHQAETGPANSPTAQMNGSATQNQRQAAGGSEQAAPRRPQSRPSAAESAAQELADKPSEHAIFDKIAENMQFATAYELPSISLSRRFDSFDRQRPKRAPATRPRAQSNPANGSVTAEPAPSQAASMPPANPDLRSSPNSGQDAVAPKAVNGGVSSTTPQQTPQQILRPYIEAEMVATYGDPRPDTAAWEAENLIEIEVPQLAGVPGQDGVVSDGRVMFHRLGARSLGDLFAAWERAGLMSKVLSFDGTYVAQPSPTQPHPTQSHHGESGSAHAWAIAFDINAEWNLVGQDPAPMTATGSVIELIDIANQHGFVWGGADMQNKAGLHFELGHRI